MNTSKKNEKQKKTEKQQIYEFNRRVELSPVNFFFSNVLAGLCHVILYVETDMSIFFFFFYNPSTKKSILPSAFDRSCVENKNKTKTSMPVLMTVLFCFFVYLFYFAKARGQSRWYCEKSYQPVVSLNCLSDGVEVCTFYKNKFFARIFTHVIHCRTTLRSRWYLSVCFWESSKCKKFNSYRRDVTRVYEWGSKFKTTKCRTADISKIRNFEYWNNKSSYWI